MSFNPNDDDDDIEDRLDDLTRELSELNDILRRAITQGGEGGPGDEGRSSENADLWDIGDTSPVARSKTEYEEFRRASSNNDTLVVPSLDGSAFESNMDKIRTRIEIFEEGFDNLSSVAAKLSDEEFSRFLNEYAIRRWNRNIPAEILEADLVRLVNPSPGFWGVRNIAGEISITPELSPLSFLRAYGEIWDFHSEPWNSLNKGPRPPDAESMGRRMDATEVNRRLADMAFERRSIDFPEEYFRYLSDENQRKFREDRE